jgi:hypothetical protein
MKDLDDTLVGLETEKSTNVLHNQPLDPSPEEALTAKKLDLLEKCNALIEATERHGSTYDAVLRSLAIANQESIKRLQDQILQLKDSIPRLEKKWIKRIKLVGTLTDLEKQAQKLKLKPEMARKKDLHKIDDFFLKSYRTLNALNDKGTRH